MKKIVIITRIKEQGSNHIFHSGKEKKLAQNSCLSKFLFDRLDISQQENKCILAILESDVFKSWVEEDVDRWTRHQHSSLDNFIAYLKVNSNFQKQFVKDLKPISDEKKRCYNMLPAFRYRKISLSQIDSKIEWFKKGEIILLPCYAGDEGERINYKPDKDFDELIKAIADTFKIKESSENYLYVHDKEGGEHTKRCGASIPQSDFYPNVKKYFGDNVRSFSHSQSSFYFTQVLSKLENLARVKILEENRQILKHPLHGISEENASFETILKKEKEVLKLD
jgi:hypothetical protein